MDEPTSPLHLQAISAALDLNWAVAIKINKQIIKLFPDNIDALNRQARAYFELGNLVQAKKYYLLVLKKDPYNPIAQKNLKIIKAAKKNGYGTPFIPQQPISSSLFLQEPGKTKVVSLLKVAEPQKLSQMYPGIVVEMVIKNRGVAITHRGIYLGVLPDDLAHQIIKLTKGGNKYQVFIKAVRVNGLSVLIKEVFRSKKFKNQPSFLESAQNITADIYTSKNLDEETEEEQQEEEQEV